MTVLRDTSSSLGLYVTWPDRVVSTTTDTPMYIRSPFSPTTYYPSRACLSLRISRPCLSVYRFLSWASEHTRDSLGYVDSRLPTVDCSVSFVQTRCCMLFVPLHRAGDSECRVCGTVVIPRFLCRCQRSREMSHGRRMHALAVGDFLSGMLAWRPCPIEPGLLLGSSSNAAVVARLPSRPGG